MARFKIKVFLLAVSFIITAIVFSQSGQTIIGKWKSEDNDNPIQMEIYKDANSLYYSKVINDSSNPSKNGRITLKKVKYDTASDRFKGNMQPPDADMEVSVTITSLTKDRLKIIAKKMFMSKTIFINRIK